MIYTLTLNPAVDYVINLDRTERGKTNRSSSENLFFGGKGINVSTALSRLGIKSTAAAIAAGPLGKVLEEFVAQNGIKPEFLYCREGNVRINVKIGEADGTETEINARGINVDAETVETLYKRLSALVSDRDILVLSGSVAPGIPEDIYAKIIKYLILEEKHPKIVMDTTKKHLKSALEYRPFLAKLNLAEAEELLGTSLKSDSEICAAAQKIKAAGALNVLISLGGRGAVFADEFGNVTKSGAYKGKAVNTAGAGDSMVAGFIAGYEKNKNYSEAFRLSVAAGSATAFSPGIFDRKTVERLMSENPEA